MEIRRLGWIEVRVVVRVEVRIAVRMVADHSSCGGCLLKSASQGPMQPAVLLMMRYCPPPRCAGASFQKPSERLLLKHPACSLLSARARVSGIVMQEVQTLQNLFLKCSLPGTNCGVHPAPPCSCAPQQAATSCVPPTSSCAGLGLSVSPTTAAFNITHESWEGPELRRAIAANVWEGNRTTLAFGRCSVECFSDTASSSTPMGRGNG